MVVAGSLSYGVGVFTCCALTCFTVLAWRRNAYGGELGGPEQMMKLHSALLVVLWLIYIFLSAMKNAEDAAA